MLTNNNIATIKNKTWKEKKDKIKAPKTGENKENILGNPNKKPTFFSALSLSIFLAKK